MDKYLQDLIRADYNRLLSRERLDVSAEVERLIFTQTIEGHAHNGHAEFKQQRFVDVTTADVVRALRLDARKVKRGLICARMLKGFTFNSARSKGIEG